ncbi:MAG: hypothetical protein C4541_06995 [Candidatus Auribacter fodinae]|uniref:Uncharacterized protein n=1 Tax=Candidatus Auribacter fodinae TaxID=2093366 RepID=A0A3A4R1X3_9BACT|nr:MAG: hypothetical protein C4541_06995 [Candidatus Auribacter fodinae]
MMVNGFNKRVLSVLVSCLIMVNLAGCVGIGPRTVVRDRFDYVSAISSSWKQQLLLNLVKTRYADAPVFLDIVSVISQYVIEGQVQAGALWADDPLGDSQSFGGAGKYTDRPTITYSPLLGEKFTKNLLTPIPVTGILFLLQSGYPADYVLRICVNSVNGVENQYGNPLTGRKGDQDFFRMAAAVRNLQRNGSLGIRGDHSSVAVMFKNLKNEEIANDYMTIRDILGINPQTAEVKVVYGSFPENDREIAILSRSMLQVLIDFSAYIDVPQSDVEEGRVCSSAQSVWEDAAPMLQVKNSLLKPGNAYVSVHYRNRWFWIDDRDYLSKRVFTFLLMLFSLTETGADHAAPIVTVPTN